MSILKDVVDRSLVTPPFEVFSNDTFKDTESVIEGRFKVICPVTKEIDNLWLKIKLTPNSSGDFVEYVSFYKWLITLEKEELGIEGSCTKIFNTINRVTSPSILKVVVSTGYKAINQKAIKKTNNIVLKKM